ASAAAADCPPARRCRRSPRRMGPCQPDLPCFHFLFPPPPWGGGDKRKTLPPKRGGDKRKTLPPKGEGTGRPPSCGGGNDGEPRDSRRARSLLRPPHLVTPT